MLSQSQHPEKQNNVVTPFASKGKTVLAAKRDQVYTENYEGL
jgi:hypothetical protein